MCALRGKILKRMWRAICSAPAIPRVPPPHEPPESLEGSPPPYESVDSNPICAESYFWCFAFRASLNATMEALKTEGSQETIMSGTIDAGEVAMEETFTGLRSIDLAFDSARYALLMAAITASLASIRGYALCTSLSNLNFDRLNIWQQVDDISSDVRDDAILAGVDAGRAAISSLYQLDTGPIPHSKMDEIPPRVAWKAAAVAIQGICFENTTRSRTITSVVDALEIGIRAGIAAGFPLDSSVAVLKATLLPRLPPAVQLLRCYPESQLTVGVDPTHGWQRPRTKQLRLASEREKALPPNRSGRTSCLSSEM
ncbi:hypothetical protein F4679DRAFT_560480 [Xylaria curta]|nr:hypothetical protein F4679DRAFT_560480 [Xylaria curta]